MRTVFVAGAAAAIVFVLLNRAIWLLNRPSDLAVAAGYILLLALFSLAVGFVTRLWRRL
jgi:hypothetical protein